MFLLVFFGFHLFYVSFLWFCLVFLWVSESVFLLAGSLDSALTVQYLSKIILEPFGKHFKSFLYTLLDE